MSDELDKNQTVIAHFTQNALAWLKKETGLDIQSIIIHSSEPRFKVQGNANKPKSKIYKGDNFQGYSFRKNLKAGREIVDKWEQEFPRPKPLAVIIGIYRARLFVDKINGQWIVLHQDKINLTEQKCELVEVHF